MLYGYPVEGNAAEAVEAAPDGENEFVCAKTFLQKASTETGDNLYDHLAELLDKILAERPQNAIDLFEDYSRKLKERRFRPSSDRLEDVYVAPGAYDLAQKMLQALGPLPNKPPSTLDPEDLEKADMSGNNLLEMLFYLEQAGLGLPRQEMVFVMLSMRQLASTRPISSVKFWGKILGSFRSYLVVETELTEEEYAKRHSDADEETVLAVRDLEEERPQLILQEEGGRKPLPPLPQIQYREPEEAAPEPCGLGLNKKTYFVCTGVGADWIELPDVTPKQIRVARQIYKAFSGDLDAGVYTYPEFPGVEKNYLRAQIARISAGTRVAPLGYYSFGSEELGEGAEEEELEEGPPRGSFQTNPRYEPHALKDLLDASLSFWVHTEPYILPQGRTTWWNPGPEEEERAEDEQLGEEEEDEDRDDEAPQLKYEAETGPALLTPLSEDASLETTNAWSTRSTSDVVDMHALALIRSNLWPGAYALCASTKTFYNIYVGRGLKYLQSNFSPQPLPGVMREYPLGPEILEMVDPSGKDEEDWRVAHAPKPKEVEEVEGEQEDVEGEEAEEEDEDEEDED